MGSLDYLNDREAREQWLHARLATVGASEVSALIGVDPYRSALQVWQEKTGRKPPGGPDWNENEHIEMGHRLEPIVCDIYQDRTGDRLIDPGRYEIRTNPAFPHMSATLDRIILGSDADGDGVLEVKAPGAWMEGEWSDDQGQTPLRFQVQLQQQLAITGYKWGCLAALVGGKHFYMQPYRRHEGLIQKILAKVQEFWGYVERDEEPPADGTQSARRVLEDLHDRAKTAGTVELPAEALELHTAREAALKDRKAAQKVIDETSNRLRQLIGDAEYGHIPEEDIMYRWYKVTRRAYTVPEGEYASLRKMGGRRVS